MQTVIEPANLPEIGIQSVLIGLLPARAINPKLKQGGIASVDAPRPFTAQQFSNQVLQNPAMGNNPNLLTVAMTLKQGFDKDLGSATGC